MNYENYKRCDFEAVIAAIPHLIKGLEIARTVRMNQVG